MKTNRTFCFLFMEMKMLIIREQNYLRVTIDMIKHHD